MQNENLLGYVLLIFIFMIIIKIYYESDMFHLSCVVSTVDGNKYCVRERKNVHKAADLLARTAEKMKDLVDHLQEKYPQNEHVILLVKNFNPNKIKETLPTSEYTAYSENKGEKIAFCLGKEKETSDDLIEENTLTFVALHELSHLGTKSIGHKEEFWRTFKFFLEEAAAIGIYRPVDYKNSNTEYCGMTIDDNPYFDYK